MAYLLTSYADTAGTTSVNQVENVYPGAAAHTRPGGGTGFRGVEFCEYLGRCASPLNNGFGQLTQQYQATASPRKVKVEQANRRAQGNGRYLALACGPWGGGHRRHASGKTWLQ